MACSVMLRTASVSNFGCCINKNDCFLFPPIESLQMYGEIIIGLFYSFNKFDTHTLPSPKL